MVVYPTFSIYGISFNCIFIKKWRAIFTKQQIMPINDKIIYHSNLSCCSIIREQILLLFICYTCIPFICVNGFSKVI